jgi:hypothetical protein
MRALFITTQTNDTHNLVDAWDSINGSPADRVKFYYQGIRRDGLMLSTAKTVNPDVIFYVGGCTGIGLPKFRTFRELRQIAPLVNLIPDAADPPWHGTIRQYREEECFDLHVGLDGCPGSPVDHLTVTPVDLNHFKMRVDKNIHCGFSGGLGGNRSELIKAILPYCSIRIRNAISGKYADHAYFLKRCRMIFNTAWTGSGKYYHIKGRVIEAGYAGAALIEHVNSPIDHWFPKETCFRYSDGDEAIDIIKSVTNNEINEKARFLSRVVKKKYSSMKIYRGILNKLDISYSFV